jgi:hypothetical protein
MDKVILSYLESKDASHEFEVRYSDRVSRLAYNSIVRTLSSAGFKIQADQKLLRISTADCRVQITGLLNIKAYCENDRLLDATFQKKVVKASYVNAYGMKGALSTEVELSPKEEEQLRDEWGVLDKTFRFMHRITLAHPDHPAFKVDCSVVKSSTRHFKRFSLSDVFSRPETCEVEIEAVRREAFEVFKRQLNKISTLVLGGLQGTPYPVALAELKNVLADYSKLTKCDLSVPLHRRFVGPNCVTLQHANLAAVATASREVAEEEEVAAAYNTHNIRRNYVVTDKADGLRKLLYVRGGRLYFVTSKMEVEYTGSTVEDLDDTLLDGEFVEADKDGKPLRLFACFDVYFVRRVDMRAKPFPDRKAALDNVVAQLRGLKFHVTVKTFYGGDIFAACRDCLNTRYDYVTDGLIFTPTEYGVGMSDVVKAPPDKTTAWALNFKWKPAALNTIDFKVVAGRETGTYTTVSLLIVGTAQNWENPYTVMLEQDTHAPRAKDGLRAFLTDEDPVSHQANFELKDGNMRAADGDIIESGMVVECSYDAARDPYWRWTPLRVRWDKELPNGFVTAHNNWQTIMNPITVEMITGKQKVEDTRYYVGNRTEMQGVRFFHRHVKGVVLKQVAKPGMKLVDFAVGEGGDLGRWRSERLSFVFGMDISKENIHNREHGACVRYLEQTSRNSDMYALFVVGDATKDVVSGEATSNETDKAVTLGVLGKKPRESVKQWNNVWLHHNTRFDLASMMFAVHYMFKSAATLTQFVKNVVECTKVGGHFIGCAWDGELVFEKLKGTPPDGILGLNKVTVVKRYCKEEFSKDDSLGFAIDVSQSTFNQSTEYLVHYGYLEGLLARNGFRLVRLVPFQQEYAGYKAALAEDEKELSFLNKYFIFEKVEHVKVVVTTTKFTVARIGAVTIKK